MTVSAGSLGSADLMSVSGPLAVGRHQVGGPSDVSFMLNVGFGGWWLVGLFTTGGSGTLTISTATDTRVAGAFSFTGVADTPGLTPATRTVTNGTFDLSR